MYIISYTLSLIYSPSGFCLLRVYVYYYLMRENKYDYFFFQIENDHVKSGFDLLRADLYLYVHMLYVFI